MGKGSEISAITPVAEELRVNLILLAGRNAVLDVQPLGKAGPIVDVRQISDLLLADGLRAEAGGLNEELREVGPQCFAREAAPEEQIRCDLATAVAWPRYVG